MANRVRVSIIVLCHDLWADTERCLKSLRRTTPAGLYELLVYDNSSSDGTLSHLRRLSRGWPQLRVFRNSRNLSFARAVNRGMRASRGEYFLWLNNDTVLSPGWLEGLLSASTEAHVGAAGPMTDHAAPPDQTIPPFTSGPRPEKTREAAVLGGFCFLLKRRAVESAGWLDERFVWGWEDIDYCLRLRQAGWGLRIAGGVLVRHAGNRTLEGMPRARRETTDHKNRRLILAKWSKTEPFRRELWDLFEQIRVPWWEPRLTTASILLLRSGAKQSSAPRVGLLGLPSCETLRLDFRGEKRVETLNLALSRARGQYFALVEDGKSIPNGWLKRLVLTACSQPHVGVVGLASGLAARTSPLSYVPTGCLLIARRALAEVGEFDFRLSWELSWADYCLRVLQAGYRILEIGGNQKARPGAEALTPTQRDRDHLVSKWLAGYWHRGESALRFWQERIPDERLAPECTIAVICRGDWADARRCLESLRLCMGGSDCEILVADLSRTGEVSRHLGKFGGRWPELKSLGWLHGWSWSRALNLAKERAQGEYIAIVGENAIVKPGWLAGLILASRQAADIGAVGPCIEGFSFPGQECGSIRRGRRAVRSVFRLSNTCLLIPSRVMAEVGRFDEKFSGRTAWADYALSLLQAGMRMTVAESSRVRRVSREEGNPRWAEVEDRKRVLSKWAGHPLLTAGFR